MAKNKKNTISKSFSHWAIEDVVKVFGLQIKHKGEGMEHLLHSQEIVTEVEKARLLKLQSKMIEKVGVWNEIELEIFFIAPILELLDWDDSGAESFIEKPFGAVVDNYYLSGEMDWIIAKGYGKPEAPFFCVKEFKKAKNSSNDPEGQLASALLAAYQLNIEKYGENIKPVYGLYIMGREWFLCMYQNRQLNQSLPFLTTDEGMLLTLFAALKALKKEIKQDIK